MIDVLFRADDGPGIGAGHLMRCYALAEQVVRQGGAICLSSARSSVLHSAWRDIGANVMVGQREIGGEADLSQFLEQAGAMDAAWLVVDGYGFKDSWLDAAGQDHYVLCIDDLGERNPAVSLVLNHNAGAQRRYRTSYDRCGRALLGLDWFLLQRAWRDETPKTERGRLLVTLGADDPQNRTLDVMRALVADERPFSADVVSAAPEARYREAQEFAHSFPGHFRLHRAPVPLAPLMAAATVVISGGGVTPLEALSLQVVPVILVLADNQRPGADALAEAGAALVAGSGDDALVRAASQALDLLSDADLRKHLLAGARGLVDGQGAARVVNVMMESAR